MVLPVRPEIRFRDVGTNADFSHVAIPGPYAMTPPVGQEMTDAYYVVDYGREVGIFSDKYVVHSPDTIILTSIASISSTRAITGIPHGHQVKVKTWYDAVKLYNSLRNKGFIVRVQY